MRGESRRTIRERTAQGSETQPSKGFFGRIEPFFDPTIEAKIAKIQRPLNRFEIFGAIGSGGCATVHIGSHEGEIVAVKKINDAIKDPNQRSSSNRLIANEYDLMQESYKRIQEAAIKPISLESKEDQIRLIMKLNQYPTVETFVRIAKLNEAEKAALLIGCAKSLQKMHENGIIHRDIKESNLYIDIDGIKIGDFGTAQVEGKEDKVKRYFERPGAIGTDRYKAPEIERDNLFHIPGEVYAFGIMMYRIFEGKHPFAAKENEEILKWHREGVVPKTTSTVSKIIERCLEKDHRQRPSSIGLIGDEIANLFEKTGIKIPKI